MAENGAQREALVTALADTLKGDSTPILKRAMAEWAVTALIARPDLLGLLIEAAGGRSEDAHEGSWVSVMTTSTGLLKTDGQYRTQRRHVTPWREVTP